MGLPKPVRSPKPYPKITAKSTAINTSSVSRLG